MQSLVRGRAVRAALLALLVTMAVPGGVAADAELETVTPADASTIPGPFDGPIVLTFSGALDEGSRADLIDEAGDVLASADVDGEDATMTIQLDDPLAAGEYEVRWVSVAIDGHLLRDTVTFTVSEPPTPEPTPEPTPTPEPSASPTASPATPAPSPSASPSASASPSPDGDSTGSTGDVLLPIIVGVVVAGAGGAYLLTRRRSTPT